MPTKNKILGISGATCSGCGNPYLVPWGWIYTESGAVIPLDGGCSRRLRYSQPEERAALIREILTRVEKDGPQSDDEPAAVETLRLMAEADARRPV
jgi:hypothetical protein